MRYCELSASIIALAASRAPRQPRSPAEVGDGSGAHVGKRVSELKEGAYVFGKEESGGEGGQYEPQVRYDTKYRQPDGSYSISRDPHYQTRFLLLLYFKHGVIRNC